MVNPSLETLVALKPDLVVGTDEGNREETFVQLQRLGIPVYIVHAHRISEMYELIARVGALTGRRDAVGPLVTGIQRRIDAVRAAVKARPAPRVLYVLWPDPLLVPGGDSHLTEMIELAGGRSMTGGGAGRYGGCTIEAGVRTRSGCIVPAHQFTRARAAG